MLSWHVATTKPFSEMIAEEGLRRKGFQPFNPKCYTQRVVRGARVWTERPYLPGYIFVRFDAREDNWPQINFVRGIQALLYSAYEKPAPIRDAVMAVLLEHCNAARVKAEELDQALSKFFAVGSDVRVTEGAFAHLCGRVAWSDRDRVGVVLHLFGRRPTNVSLSSKSLEPA